MSTKTPTIRIQSGICYTFFAVVLSGLLILALVAISRYLTIEKHLKSQFRSPSQEYYSLSPDRGFIPLLDNQVQLNQDISQLYYYHDCCYRDNFQALPGTILKKIRYSKNKKTETPSVTIFKAENILFCIFRSTKTKTEMKKDVEMNQVVGMHSGIRDIYNDINQTLFDCIENNMDCQKIVLFGHSLGGALVDITSNNMINLYPEMWKKTNAFSSGSPRVFTPERCDSFSNSKDIERYMKLVNEADMVNHLPVTVTVTGGLFRDGKKYFYKSFCNQSRIYRFNDVKETQILDSHISKTYSDNLWNLKNGNSLPKSQL